jgi:hypothetical protein
MSNRRSSKEDEPTEKTSLLDDEKKGEDNVLSSGPAVNIYDKSNLGYLAQYYAVGLIYGGLPATVYGFFVGYLNVPAYVYSTSGVIMTMPWSFKFFFGAINDCCPIFGYRRKPYMVIGWAFCSMMLVVLSTMALPDPYWCVNPETGEYIVKKTMTDGSTAAAEPCNAEAAKQGGRFAMVMMLAALGYVIADVAADGLTVEFARREPVSRRGRTQTTAYLTRTLGSVSSILLVGFGMNSREYNGSFDAGFSFNTICGILAVPSALMVPISWFFISETKCTDPMSFSAYAKLSYQLLKSKALFYVVLYQFLTSMIGQISTTAGGMVKNYWAGVQNLQNQLFSLVGNLLFGIGLYLVRKHFLNFSWRKMLLITSVGLNIVDMPFVFLTIYNVVRNQYFYLGETVLVEIPAAANFVVGTFVIVEMAENGNEGLVYGLLTTMANLGGPFARAIGNQLYGLFRPSLSDSDNYIEDSGEFRNVVAFSFVLSYGFAFLSLFALFLLPSQKEETQRRKATWPQKTWYAVFTLSLVAVALTYSLIVNFLSMFESTMCLRFAGGDGCEEEQAAGKPAGAAGQLLASAMTALRALDNATTHNATFHR